MDPNPWSRRRRLIVMAVPVVLSMAASTAWACTVIVGATSVNPTSGPRGSKVNGTGTELSPGKTYNFKLNDSASLNAGTLCMHSVTMGKGTAAATGIVTATGTVPRKAALGAGQACFVDALHAFDSTTPTAFTVT